MTTRMTHEERRSVIVNAGVKIANRNGLVAVSMNHVANECEIPTSFQTVRDHFRTKSDLWRAIADHADASKTVKRDAELIGLVGN